MTAPTVEAISPGTGVLASARAWAEATVRRAPAALVVLVLGLAGIAVYFAVPAGVQDPLFVAYGSLAGLLLVWGATRRLTVQQSIPWVLIAASQILFSVGDGVLNFYADITGHEAPFPSAADIVYLSAYPVLTAGVYLLVRRLAHVEGLFVYVDAALIAAAFALVQWVFTIEPYIHHVDESVYGRVVLMAYPAMDVLVVAVLARFFVTPAWRTAAYGLLVPAMLFLVAADEVYVSNIDGYVSGQWSDAFWLISYLLIGVTGLTPSMQQLSRARNIQVAPRLSPARLGLLALALVSAPITLILRAETPRHSTVYLLGAAGIALSAMALVRIVGLVRGIDILRTAERDARQQVERAHALLEEQNEQLIAADRMKDEFIGMISHDLRTPLVSATGFLELLADGDAGALNDEQMRYVGFVQRASDRLLRQIEDLLVATSLQAGRFALAREEISLADIAEEAVEGQRAMAAAKGVELRLALDQAPRVHADPLRIAQVVDNLLSNAIKFTPKGGSVEVRLLPGDDGRSSVLEVADSGIGIPDAEQAALFERFFRTSDAVERRIPGTGLGLYICKSLVEAHGGQIRLRSAAGEGTTFTVALPAADGDVAAAQPAAGGR